MSTLQTFLLYPLLFIFSFVFWELIVNLIVFPGLNRLFKVNKNKTPKGNLSEQESEISPVLKGIIERLCLTLGLSLGFQSILVVFGALKIGTRLSPTNRKKVANDYFLLGNLISIMTSLLIYYTFSAHDLINLLLYLGLI